MKHYLIYVASLSLLLASGCGSLSAPSIQPRVYNITQETDAGDGAQVQGEDGTAKMASTIAPYKAQLDAKMNRQLATLATPLTKQGAESSIGNWMADLMMAAAIDRFVGKDISFATANSGGIRVQEIGTGPLLVSEIYEMMPFDNELVLLDLSGAELKAFISHIANSGGWPVSEELSVKLTKDKLLVNVSGKEIDPAARYLVATVDYVANGGSGSSMVKGKPQIASNERVRDLLIEFAAKATAPISVKAEGKRMSLRK